MAHRIPFRHRAHEVSRLEAFSDVIFGFAISLLVVSLEAPKSYAQLMEMMHGFVPFAICFLIFIDLWHEHHTFFKRYALQDNVVLALNTLLLFVILFYVYPLKYVFTMFISGLTGHRTEALTTVQATNIFTIYGLGFAAVFWTIAAMYYHAYRRREALALNELEVIETRESIWDSLLGGMFGVISAAIAHTPWPGVAGMIYFLLFIPKTLVPSYFGDKRKKAEERMLAARDSAPEAPGPSAPSNRPQHA